METPRLPGQRAGLTRDRVLAAAHEVLADGGIDALTMRALAERLGVRPNALYSHVEDKTALVDELLDGVLAEVEARGARSAKADRGGGRSAADDPVEAMHALMASTHEVLLAHPELVPLYLARRGARGPNAQRLGEIMLALLGRAGVTGPPAREALRVLIAYTIGFAAFVTGGSIEPADDDPAPADELIGNFDRGLRWLLAGIAPTRSARARR